VKILDKGLLVAAMGLKLSDHLYKMEKESHQ